MSTEIKIPGAVVRPANVHYWNIVGGALAKRVPAGTPGAKSRLNKEGTEVWEIVVQELTGYLERVEVRDGKFATELVLTLKYIGDDGEATHILSVPDKSGAYYMIINRLNSVDVSQPVRIVVYKKGEKTIATLLQGKDPLAPTLYRVEGDKMVILDKRVKPYPKDWNSLPEKKKEAFRLERATIFEEIAREYADKLRQIKEAQSPGKEAIDEAEAEAEAEKETDESFDAEFETMPF